MRANKVDMGEKVAMVVEVVEGGTGPVDLAGNNVTEFEGVWA